VSQEQSEEQPEQRSAVEIARDSYASFERDDIDALLADLDPDIVWEQAQGLPHGGTYHGIDEVRRNIFDPLDRDWWDGFTARPEEFIDGGDEVVVLGRYRGVAKESRRTLDVPFVHVWSIRAGRTVRFRQFLDTAGWNTSLVP
jgi:ketosteroid isomerase-like protein